MRLVYSLKSELDQLVTCVVFHFPAACPAISVNPFYKYTVALNIRSFNQKTSLHLKEVVHSFRHPV